MRARFAAVLDTDVTQSTAFRHVSPAVEAALGGLNSTVFAYGQTGSGKTYTLFGGLLAGEPPPPSADGSEPGDGEGMAARALRHIFSRAEAAAEVGVRLAVSCSFLEVYNEHITDLLLPAGGRAAWAAAAARTTRSACTRMRTARSTSKASPRCPCTRLARHWRSCGVRCAGVRSVRPT